VGNSISTQYTLKTHEGDLRNGKLFINTGTAVCRASILYEKGIDSEVAKLLQLE
jgi:hypothetical protein